MPHKIKFFDDLGSHSLILIRESKWFGEKDKMTVLYKLHTILFKFVKKKQGFYKRISKL